MAMEFDMKTFRNEIAKANNEKIKTNKKLTFVEVLDLVRNELSEKLIKNFEENKKKEETVIKNKEYLKNLKKDRTRDIRLIISQSQIKCEGYSTSEELVKALVEDIVGYSVISPLMENPNVTDIFCNEYNNIHYEENGESKVYDKSFRDKKHFKEFIERLLRDAGKEMNNGESKIVDFSLYGNRYCAISNSVSKRDCSLVLRKHSDSRITIDNLLEKNVLSEDMNYFISKIIDGECNVIVAGITGSGKTTSLRAFLDGVITSKRMVVCEDTRELFPKNRNSLELECVKNDNEKSNVPLEKLVITSLRLKPKYIVCGEIRGPEIESAVEAMATGHSTITSLHAGTPMDAINRIITKYLVSMPSLSDNIVERIIGSALDYIIIQDDIPNIGRKMTSITEVAYDYEAKRIKLTTIYEYDARKKEFQFLNKISSEKAKKMLRRGVRPDEIEGIVDWTK